MVGDSDLRVTAMVRFKWSIVLLIIAGIAMAAAAVFYLSRFGPLTGTLVFTVITGVFVSVLLGGGLMALGFLSASNGHDVDAAGATAATDRETSAPSPGDA
jgi:hypothetical protein